MANKEYIKKCCYFCTEREVNCKGCSIAAEGIKAIRKNCIKWIELGECRETFNGSINKNLCFSASDEDAEELEGKHTESLSIGDKEEEIKKEEPKKPAETKEEKTIKIADALTEAAKAGDLDLDLLLKKLHQV